VSYWAWTEWWPNGFIVDNLAISPGDVVSVLVCAPLPDHGFVLMENLTTDRIVSVGVDPPAGLTPMDLRPSGSSSRCRAQLTDGPLLQS
jgi:hypothetical protein